MQERYLNPHTDRDIVNAINTAKKDCFAQGIAQGREEGIAQGREEGIVQGREEGIAQGLAHVAKTMLDNGMDVQTISKMTGLPVSDIEDIIKKK